MELIHVVFWVFALITCGSALLVAFSPKLIHSVFSLFFCFVGTAGLYVLLGADFLAATQVIIYIGGIMVLMIFGVMLTNRHGEGHLPNEFTNGLSAALLALGLVFLFWSFPRSWALRDSRWTRNFDDVSMKVVPGGSHAPGSHAPGAHAPGSHAPGIVPVNGTSGAAEPTTSTTGTALAATVPTTGTAVAVNSNLERVPPVSNTTGPIGEALLTQYLIPFELGSLVLLLAMLGAASIARKEIR